MKKTLTINLNNIVFHIDDDAYEILHTYLEDIGAHFQSEEERKEIMTDIEARIAELFSEKLQKNKTVVNITDVEEIIEIMGKPSQYADDEEEESTPRPPKTEKKNTRGRRFYRDPENAILGGIAGGIAAYFSWDVTLVRIALFVLSLLSVGNFILIYLIVWVIAPKAVTASQRLEMQGEDVTIENIKTEINNVKNYVDSDKIKQNVRHGSERVGDILKIFLKIIVGFLGTIFGFVGIVVIGVLLFVLAMLAFHHGSLDMLPVDFGNTWSILSPENAVLMVISLLLVVGCPIFMLIYWAIRVVSGNKNRSMTATWVVIILWLAGIFMLSSLSAKTIFKFRDGKHHFNIDWNDNGPTNTEERSCQPFNAIEADGAVHLELTQDSLQHIELESTPKILANVTTVVEDSILKIHFEGINLNRGIEARIHIPSLKSIVVRGASSINTTKQFKSNELFIEATGASKADMDMLVTGKFTAEVKGASTANLKGNCNEAQIHALGASTVNAFDLISPKTQVNASGACTAYVYASEKLDASANGASKIDCKGKPKTVTKSDLAGSSVNVY